MGWSWRELQETPADVVSALVVMLTEQAREAASAQAARSARPPRRRR